MSKKLAGDLHPSLRGSFGKNHLCSVWCYLYVCMRKIGLASVSVLCICCRLNQCVFPVFHHRVLCCFSLSRRRRWDDDVCTGATGPGVCAWRVGWSCNKLAGANFQCVFSVWVCFTSCCWLVGWICLADKKQCLLSASDSCALRVAKEGFLVKKRAKSCSEGKRDNSIVLSWIWSN